MHAPVRNTDHCYIISSPVLDCELSGDCFDLEQNKGINNLRANNNGRSAVAYITLGSERGVLRHYYRGGVIASISNDKFIWSGLNRTRALREYRLLEWMIERDLPVPVALGARVVKTGLLYTCDLITREVPETETLANKLHYCDIDRQHWYNVGGAIKSLHNHGVYHSDLNANNILLNKSGIVTIIDFDRCRRRNGDNWKNSNVNRLQRSLEKLSGLGTVRHFSTNGWQSLIDGYHA